MFDGVASVFQYVFQAKFHDPDQEAAFSVDYSNRDSPIDHYVLPLDLIFLFKKNFLSASNQVEETALFCPIKFLINSSYIHYVYAVSSAHLST